MRTVIYARFSSDNQNPRSIADQVAMCRLRAEREGWPVVAVFEDAAISGAAGIGEAQRPGLNAMLKLVESGGVDQVLAESTDRISRHVADAHLIRERIEFAGARLFTLIDGTVTPIVALVKGFTDSQFRSDLAVRVRRGQSGRIKEGRSAGGAAYGYRVANRLDERGKLVAGLREIDEEKAEIVRRIYREYSAGQSPRAICARLNAEGIPGPRGGQWLISTISGGKKSTFSILRNPIYIGRLLYGRTKTVMNPVTRAVLMRPNPNGDLTEGHAPHLRIIDDALWERVQDMLARNSFARPERARRPKHLLSGLGVCGGCGGNWVKVSPLNWGCARHFNQASDCINNRTMATRKYEREVLADLKAGMLAPDVVSAYLREYHRNFAEAKADMKRERAKIERQLAEATRKMERLLKVVAEGGSEFAEIRTMLATARDDKERLTRELASIDALPDVIELHPRLEEEYRRQVDELEAALADPTTHFEAIPRLRDMIARVIVRPNPTGRGAVVEVVRQLDQVLGLAMPKAAGASR